MLGFAEPLERDFQREYVRQSLPVMRVGFLLGATLYFVFVFLDAWMLPVTKHIALLIRLGLGIPVLLGAFLLTFTKIFERHSQRITTSAIVVAGSGITLMIAFAEPTEPGFFYYDKGLLLAMSFTYTLLRLQFVPTTVACLGILAGYELVAIFFHGMISDGAGGYLMAAFVGNNFFLVSTMLVTLFASYWLEVYARRSFVQRRQIETEKAAAIAAMDELRATQSQLVQSERMAVLGNLVAGLVHELSTPVAAIESSSMTAGQALERMKLERDTASARTAEGPSRILEDCHRNLVLGTRRIRQILDNLKKFSRLDRAPFGRIDVHESLEATLAVLAAELGDRIDVVRDFRSVPTFHGYPGDLNQLFMNLLLNAVQAIPDRGTLRLSTRAEKDEAIVEISDDGVGIPQERLDRLFVPTFSAGRDRVKAGLGLFVSYRIVEKHQGRIRIESAPGRGTTVVLRFPLGEKGAKRDPLETRSSSAEPALRP